MATEEILQVARPAGQRVINPLMIKYSISSLNIGLLLQLRNIQLMR